MREPLLIAIPCFRCRDFIGPVIRSLCSCPETEQASILVIDNDSQDGTLEQAKQALEQCADKRTCALLKNQRNFGLGGTWKLAVSLARQASCRSLCFFHGDGQAHSEDFGRLHRLLDSEPALDAVLGSRFMTGSRLQDYSPLRTLGNKGLNLLFSLVIGMPVSDLGSGLNFYRLAALPAGDDLLALGSDLAFDVDLLLYYAKKRRHISFQPITWSEDGQISNADNLRVGLSIVKRIMLHRLAGKSMDKRRQQVQLTSEIIYGTFLGKQPGQILTVDIGQEQRDERLQS